MPEAEKDNLWRTRVIPPDRPAARRPRQAAACALPHLGGKQESGVALASSNQTVNVSKPTLVFIDANFGKNMHILTLIELNIIIELTCEIYTESMIKQERSRSKNCHWIRKTRKIFHAEVMDRWVLAGFGGL